MLSVIKQGADAKAKDQYGNMPLHFSAYNNNVKTAELLIKAGADINARNNNGDTPLHVAYGCENREMIALLISKGGDQNIKNNENKTAKDYITSGVALKDSL